MDNKEKLDKLKLLKNAALISSKLKAKNRNTNPSPIRENDRSDAKKIDNKNNNQNSNKEQADLVKKHVKNPSSNEFTLSKITGDKRIKGKKPSVDIKSNIDLANQLITESSIFLNNGNNENNRGLKESEYDSNIVSKLNRIQSRVSRSPNRLMNTSNNNLLNQSLNRTNSTNLLMKKTKSKEKFITQAKTDLININKKPLEVMDEFDKINNTHSDLKAYQPTTPGGNLTINRKIIKGTSKIEKDTHIINDKDKTNKEKQKIVSENLRAIGAKSPINKKSSVLNLKSKVNNIAVSHNRNNSKDLKVLNVSSNNLAISQMGHSNSKSIIGVCTDKINTSKRGMSTNEELGVLTTTSSGKETSHFENEKDLLSQASRDLINKQSSKISNIFKNNVIIRGARSKGHSNNDESVNNDNGLKTNSRKSSNDQKLLAESHYSFLIGPNDSQQEYRQQSKKEENDVQSNCFTLSKDYLSNDTSDNNPSAGKKTNFFESRSSYVSAKYFDEISNPTFDTQSQDSIKHPTNNGPINKNIESIEETHFIFVSNLQQLKRFGNKELENNSNPFAYNTVTPLDEIDII